MEAARILKLMVNAFPDVEAYNAQQIDNFMEMADAFFRWERERMLLGDPTPEEQKDHREILTLLTKLVNWMMRIDSSNDRMKMLKIRLGDSEGMFYSTMTDEESAAILTRAFPG